MRSFARCTANLPHLHCVDFRRPEDEKRRWLGGGSSKRSCSRRGVSGGGDPSLIGRLRRCSTSVIGSEGDLPPSPSTSHHRTNTIITTISRTPSPSSPIRRCSTSVIGLGGCPPSDLTPTPSPSTMQIQHHTNTIITTISMTPSPSPPSHRQRRFFIRNNPHKG